MILADKIMELRKKNGWSQEELAQQLGVSRQAVSKWESAASIPDLDKIMKMSDLFGVSTDSLLKDSIELPSSPEVSSDFTTEEMLRSISLEEATGYMQTVRSVADKIALGVALCILSPLLVVYLGGLNYPDGIVVGFGVSLLIVLVAAAVGLFIFFGRKLSPYEYLEKENFELAYGVTGVIRTEKERYSPTNSLMLIGGVMLCILSAVPILISAALEKESLTIKAVCLCLILIAAGVYLIVRTSMIYGSFQKLLEEGDYSRENKRFSAVDSIYWSAVTAGYLGWSFLSMEWHRTWIIWPIAGVLYGLVRAIATAAMKKRQ